MTDLEQFVAVALECCDDMDGSAMVHFRASIRTWESSRHSQLIYQIDQLCGCRLFFEGFCCRGDFERFVNIVPFKLPFIADGKYWSIPGYFV